MGISLHVKRNRFPELLGQMREQASKAVRETCFAIQEGVLDGMSQGKSGRIYGDHVASAPGEMPAIDTGTLAASIQVDAEPGSLQGAVYTNQETAVFLEYGTTRMAPRPYLTPAAENERAAFERRMAAIGRGLR